ncbi:hypothetical protein SO694_000930111 [Aureococcus anophagefferens]|uniref:Uncharacterized protein n=1 Tax=Aureococcus anophagefferens TaxID=44056 RepID=A0ABR1FRQ9_AURAN
MADFERSTFGTTKARAVDHGEINARSKGQPAGDAFQKKASEWLDPDAESKRNPSSTVVTPFLPPVDEAKAEILEILIERGAPSTSTRRRRTICRGGGRGPARAAAESTGAAESLFFKHAYKIYGAVIVSYWGVCKAMEKPEPAHPMVKAYGKNRYRRISARRGRRNRCGPLGNL